ncbi:MAG TPA: FlgD immunoglobulin-like domain containing protein [Candidatus Limnocylindrales bacterium]|nr:FlgD immunoglobulin-like domain containing protein [Candidatus Limnocylindrales bacterium]
MQAGRIGWARGGRIILLLAALIPILAAALRPHESSSSTNATPDFRNFETLQVHPLAITPDGSKLLVLNTPDARLEVFAIGSGTLDTLGEVPVGMEPVSVAAQDDSTAWVVNNLSDDVSIVDLRTMSVRATVRVGDEPTDIVFAGNPLKAFVCVSDEDAVKAFDPATLAPAFPSTEIFGRHPRALAVSGDGSVVYVGVLDAGNRTHSVSAQAVSALGGPSPPNPPMDPSLPPAPEVGVIVQWDGTHWIDDGLPTPKIWDGAVPPGFTLPDVDVAVLDANSGSVLSAVSGVGTSIFNIAVDPGTSTLYVTNTEAKNRTRFEPNLRGRFLENWITLIGSGGAGPVTPKHLNAHINFAVSPGPQSERDLSLAEPIDVAVDGAAGKVYVAAMGSSRVGVLDLSGNVTNRISTAGAPTIAGVAEGEPRGPVGLALDAARHQLFALNRFTNSIAILSTDTETKVGEVALRFDPSPPEVRNGRRFLYDGNLSAHGDLGCASCHIGGDLDAIAWDLGDPLGQMVPSLQLTGVQVHPMKGPMMTQSLRGLLNTSPFHWRGDRLDFTRFNPTFINLMGAPDSLSTADMQAYNDFIMTVVYPPNPNQTLDANPVGIAKFTGQAVFHTIQFDVSGKRCDACHRLSSPGTDRTIRQGSEIVQNQDFKTPQLRNMYQKTGFTLAPAPQKRGFGYGHDGSIDNIVDFLRGPSFSFQDTTMRDALQAFMLSFNTGTAPSVGREVTVNAANRDAPEITALLDSLYVEAFDGRCDLVAHGRIAGVMRGFLSLDGHDFLSDFNSEGTIARDTLRSWATDAGPIIYMGVPPGSGMRMGVDRDRDGYFDGTELVLGSDPANPASTPAAAAVDAGGAPRVARLEQNRPNPFNPETVIPYDAGPGGHVVLRIFDPSGRLVRTLVDVDQPSGIYRSRWNGRNDRGAAVASGRYFYRLTVGTTIQTRGMVLLK